MRVNRTGEIGAFSFLCRRPSGMTGPDIAAGAMPIRPLRQPATVLGEYRPDDRMTYAIQPAQRSAWLRLTFSMPTSRVAATMAAREVQRMQDSLAPADRPLEGRSAQHIQQLVPVGGATQELRSIRRGIGQVVKDIEAGTFGNAYRGSSLETVVGSVAEQRQIFKGADHAFLWKPKLRIPDIYENAENQRAFARLLHTCDCCDTAQAVVEAIQRIDTLQIKGLGRRWPTCCTSSIPPWSCPSTRRS